MPGACLTGRMSAHDSLIEHMEEVGERLLVDHDERQHFHGAYLRSTKAVLADAESGKFADNDWARRWGLAFARLYMDAFTAWEVGEPAPSAWQVAFDASRNPDISPLRHSLLGINAHINYDLPQALLAVITDPEFDDEELMASRAADHAHVDSILVARVPEEDKRLAEVEEPGDRTIVDRVLRPFNRAGTRRFLKEGRRKVWRNTRILARARRRDEETYQAELSRLEELCGARVANLVEPRFVLISLALRGFGVDLPHPTDG